MGRDFSKAEIFIVAPKGERKRFALRARFDRGYETEKTETVKLPEIDSTNRLYRTGRLTYEEADAALRNLAKRLAGKDKKQPPEYCTANLRILNDYFDKIYGPREIKDRVSAYNRLKRAIKALGQLKLSTASPNEIFDALRAYQPNQKKRKGLISSLSQILRFIGRTDVPIPRIKKARPKIRRLTLSEFEQVAERIEDRNFFLLCWAFFSTGCRPGELFGMTTASLRPNGLSVFVSGNLDRHTEELGDTKTGEVREAVIIEEGLDRVREWLAVPQREKLAMRRARHSQMFKRAVKKAFPGDDEKLGLVFYDLRHSYATHCLDLGSPLDLVAQSLGNSVAVCNEYYTGYHLTKSGVEMLAKFLRKKS